MPPARPAGLVARPRLVRRLMDAGDIPLALLVAPAGYGKTTLLAEWAAQDPRPFAWIRSDADMPASTLAGLLDVDQMRHPGVLVLDDAQALRDPAALALLQEAAEAMPLGSQLVLSARGEPELPTGRLRAHRKLFELRTHDLAMEPPEAAALVERVDLRLSDDELDTLVRSTEGWPAGLYLAALSVRGEPDAHAAVESFAGDDRLVADYLRDEVLAPLSTAESAFLLRTSVLDTLSAPACEAVLDGHGSARTLAHLARSGAMLVSLDRSGESYRHHRLFGELLRAELRRSEPELEPELHRRASAWHGAHGHTREAIHHAVATGDIDAAAVLVWSEAGGRIAHGGSDEVGRWLAEFTPEQIGGRARLGLAAAAASLAAGHGEQVEHWTAAAGRLDDRRSDVSSQMRHALAILRACTGHEGVVRMGAEAAAAGRYRLEGSLWPATASLLEGVAHHLTGRPDEARAPLEEAGRGGGSAAPSIQVICLAQLGLIALDEGSWDEAALFAGRARSQVNASCLEGYPTVALVFAVSALVRAQRGLGEEARADLRRARQLLAALVDFMPWYEIETRTVLARAALCLGDFVAARALTAEAGGRLREAPDAPRLRTWVEETRAEVEAAMHSAGEGAALTKAEARVLQLLPTHLSVPAIADRLYVSPNTVKTHVRAVYRKLDASSRAEAVAHASAAGLLEDAQAA